MDHPHTLDQLPEGRSARIHGLNLPDLRRRRMLDLGFVPGAVVTALYASPWGSPAAYGICGAVIALRREDAAAVTIREKEAEYE